jgi:hypothetical protein
LERAVTASRNSESRNSEPLERAVGESRYLERVAALVHVQHAGKGLVPAEVVGVALLQAPELGEEDGGGEEPHDPVERGADGVALGHELGVRLGRESRTAVE